MKNFKNFALTTTAVIAFAFSVNAQKNYLKDADAAFDRHQYFNAIELYKQAYVKVKKADAKSRILYRTGFAYQKINDMQGAETYYNKAIKAKYPDPIINLKLGDCLKEQQKYTDAIVAYNAYKKEVPSDVAGENGVKSCELAQQWKDAKNTPETRLQVENMALINSKESD